MCVFKFRYISGYSTCSILYAALTYFQLTTLTQRLRQLQIAFFFSFSFSTLQPQLFSPWCCTELAAVCVASFLTTNAFEQCSAEQMKSVIRARPQQLPTLLGVHVF